MLRLVSDIFPMLMLCPWRNFMLLYFIYVLNTSGWQTLSMLLVSFIPRLCVCFIPDSHCLLCTVASCSCPLLYVSLLLSWIIQRPHPL